MTSLNNINYWVKMDTSMIIDNFWISFENSCLFHILNSNLSNK